MKPRIAYLFSLLILPIPLFAQASNPAKPPAALQSPQTLPEMRHWEDGSLGSAAGCPVAMRVQPAMAGEVVPADPSQKATKVPRLHFHVTFNSVDLTRIRSARVTVHGLAPVGRVEPVESGMAEQSKDEPRTLERVLELRIDGGKDAQSEAELWVSGFSSIRHVDLNSVTYADGRSWKAENGVVCTSEPEKFMPIGK